MKQPCFVIDESRCSGCKACMVACVEGHNILSGVALRNVIEYDKETATEKTHGKKGKKGHSHYLSISCGHCEDPACVEICPVNAMRKDDHGIVSIDHQLCICCHACEQVCPYSAPHYSIALGIMTKCDCCADRLAQGLQPRCVESCPLHAIHFGDLEELKQKLNKEDHVVSLPDSELTKPAFLIRE